MITTERERAALVEVLHGSSELVKLGADQILIITRDNNEGPDKTLLMLMPGAREFVSLSKFLERCAGDPDNGRAALLEVWPDCPAEFQEKLLAVISLAPALLGGVA